MHRVGLEHVLCSEGQDFLEDVLVGNYSACLLQAKPERHCVFGLQTATIVPLGGVVKRGMKCVACGLALGSDCFCCRRVTDGASELLEKLEIMEVSKHPNEVPVRLGSGWNPVPKTRVKVLRTVLGKLAVPVVEVLFEGIPMVVNDAKL